MQLWRLSSERKATAFDGGYGLSNDGRWNTRGRPLTYCSTVPSLAALEKRVHFRDPGLLPPQVMVAYNVPDDISKRRIDVHELPENW
jgi:RES domain-containing protein